MAKKTTKTRSKVDWEAVEAEFRAGVLSVRQIAAKHGCTHTAVNKKAKTEEWVRDLTKKVRAKAQAELMTDAVGGQQVSGTKVSSGNQTETSAENSKKSEKDIVDAAARQQVEVVRSHRVSINNAHATCKLLFAELTAGTLNIAELTAMVEAIATEEAGDYGTDSEKAKRVAALRKNFHQALSLPSRGSTMKALASSLKDLVTLERQAFNLDAKEGDGDKADMVPVEDRIKQYTRQDLIEQSGGKVADLDARRKSAG